MKFVIFRTLVIVIATLVTFFVGNDMKTYSDEWNESQRMPDKWGAASEGLQMSARLKKGIIAACKPVVLIVTMRNISKELVVFSDSYPERDFKIVVKDAQDKQIPLTRYGKSVIESGEEFRRVAVKLDAGQQMQKKLLVNRMYDMTMNGTYSIVVKRSIFKQQGKGLAEVVSNVVMVKIGD